MSDENACAVAHKSAGEAILDEVLGAIETKCQRLSGHRSPQARSAQGLRVRVNSTEHIVEEDVLSRRVDGTSQRDTSLLTT